MNAKTPGTVNFARFEMAEVLSQIGQALSLSCHSTSEDFDPLTHIDGEAEAFKQEGNKRFKV